MKKLHTAAITFPVEPCPAIKVISFARTHAHAPYEYGDWARAKHYNVRRKLDPLTAPSARRSGESPAVHRRRRRDHPRCRRPDADRVARPRGGPTAFL